MITQVNRATSPTGRVWGLACRTIGCREQPISAQGSLERVLQASAQARPLALPKIGIRYTLLLFLISLSGCAQWWEVRPYPEFVQAEIVPGDTVRIETADGNNTKLVVVAVREDRIVGEHQTILLEDIARLEKQSKSAPANPCSPQVPLGCSVPQWAATLHESQARYRDYFYPSCEQHDYCYRHGALTYGMTQTTCDYEFLQDMQAQCNPDTLVEFVLASGLNYAECSAVAMEFYQVVQKYGSSRFRSSNSSYCEYDGPP